MTLRFVDIRTSFRKMTALSQRMHN